MKPKNQKLVVFAVFVAMVVAYAIYDYRASMSEEQKFSQGRLLFKGKEDQVQKVRLKIGEQNIELEKSPDGWKITRPVQDVADNLVVEKFIEGIATESTQSTVVEGEDVDFSKFGLDHPKGEIELILNSGETFQYSIGQQKNYQGDAYLRVGDEKKVMIVSSTWFSRVEKTALDFRDKRLMRRSNANTEKFVFEKGQERFELVKKEGQWISAQHPEWRLDQNKVREVLAQLNSTAALEFIAEGDARPEELKKWGLLPPQFRISVETSSDSKTKAWMASFAQGSDKISRVQISDPPIVFKLAPSELGKFLVLNADSFRDRSEPFQFDRSKVQKVEIKLGKKTIELKSEDEAAQKLIAQLEKLTVADFGESKNFSPEQEIDLKDEAGASLLHLQWGKLRSITDSKGSQISVYSMQSSKFPKLFSISESDINSLSLNNLNKKESVQ